MIDTIENFQKFDSKIPSNIILTKSYKDDTYNEILKRHVEEDRNTTFSYSKEVTARTCLALKLPAVEYSRVGDWIEDIWQKSI